MLNDENTIDRILKLGSLRSAIVQTSVSYRSNVDAKSLRRISVLIALEIEAHAKSLYPEASTSFFDEVFDEAIEAGERDEFFDPFGKEDEDGSA